MVIFTDKKVSEDIKILRDRLKLIIPKKSIKI